MNQRKPSTRDNTLFRSVMRGMRLVTRSPSFQAAAARGFADEGGTDGLREWREARPTRRPLVVVEHSDLPISLSPDESALLRLHRAALLKGVLPDA